MAIEVFIPKLGANMTEGKIEAWYVEEGEEVDIGDPLFDLVTDKATVVVEAEARGIVKKILVPENGIVPIVTTVAVIGSEDEDISSLLKEIEEREREKEETPVVEKEKPEPKEISLASRLEKPSPGIIPIAGKIKASPKARLLAKNNKIDLASVIPTGKGGIITYDDIENHITRSGQKKKVVIIGAGEYSRVILEIFNLSDDIEAAGYVDDNKSLHGKVFAGIPVLGGSGVLSDLHKQDIDYFIVSIGVPKIRSLLFNRCLDAGLKPINAIHPRSCVSLSAEIQGGAVIEAFSVIAVNSVVERGSFVTQNCSVSHDCRLKEFCHLAPGCHLGGAVNVGRGTLIGVGAAIAPHLDIGNHVIVTPGTSIDSSIPGGSVVEGVPGRIIGKTSMKF